MAETLDWAGRISAALRLDAVAAGKSGDLLTAIGTSVQGYIERATGRFMTPTPLTEIYSGDGNSILVTNQDPIRSVTSLIINGSAVTVAATTDVPTWPPAKACLIRRSFLELTGLGQYSFTPGVANIFLSYVAGFDPNDDGAALVLAGVEWAKQIFKNADRVGLKSTTTGGQTATYTDDAPPFMKLAIASHRRLMKWSM